MSAEAEIRTDACIPVYGAATFFLAVPFRIYEKTGVLTTTVSLDYETTTYFEFDVHVYDSSNPPKSANATLRVKVENVNDHHPLFNADRYEGTVTEDDGRSRPGQQVLLVRCSLTFHSSNLSQYCIDQSANDILMASLTSRPTTTTQDESGPPLHKHNEHDFR